MPSCTIIKYTSHFGVNLETPSPLLSHIQGMETDLRMAQLKQMES